ncbi:hypothetical protein ACXWOK_10710, partial [Streptococcus pyogenes]
HAPMWGATLGKNKRVRRILYFNPRTHVGCDIQMRTIKKAGSLFQSTHPCGVRRWVKIKGYEGFYISIHAP